MHSRALRGLVLALAVAGVAGPVVAQDTVDLAPFLKRQEFNQMLLSPTGEYLAATVPLEDSTGLVVMTREKKAIVAKFSLGRDKYIAGFDWVSPTRLLLSIAQQFGSLDQPALTGELYALDADGSKARLLVGPRAATGPSGESVSASLVDDLPDDDQKVLISVSPWSTDPYTRLEAMDTFSGRRTIVARSPVRRAGFLTDHQGVARFTAGADADNKSELYYRKDASSEWTLVNDEAVTGRSEFPVAFSADDRTAYFQVEQAEGPDAIVAYDIATGTRKELLRDATFSPGTFLGTLGGATMAGVRYHGAESHNEFIDEDSTEARLYRSLEASFPGQRVTIVSSTRDGKLALVLLDGPNNPGDYFLFEVEKSHASYLASKRRWMDPAKMAPTRPVTIAARDGLELRGFLTTPNGSSGRNLPFIVMPHGGPFGINDTAHFDDDAEMLARAGYAVLRLNYRGSGGRGRAFEQAGKRQWGLKMQDDLTDATKWAVREGIADGNRVCMYGGSYGGYASLMALAKEPDLYRCAIGYVGVYDLQLLHSMWTTSASGSRRAYVNEWIGDRDELAATSPTALASKIKDPVFLAAGLQDSRADPEHTRRMEKALRAAGVPVDAFYAQGEGHGFYTDANRRELWTRMLAFLSTHIGGKRAAPAAP